MENDAMDLEEGSGIEEPMPQKRDRRLFPDGVDDAAHLPDGPQLQAFGDDAAQMRHYQRMQQHLLNQANPVLTFGPPVPPLPPPLLTVAAKIACRLTRQTREERETENQRLKHHMKAIKPFFGLPEEVLQVDWAYNYFNFGVIRFTPPVLPWAEKLNLIKEGIRSGREHVMRQLAGFLTAHTAYRHLLFDIKPPERLIDKIKSKRERERVLKNYYACFVDHSETFGIEKLHEKMVKMIEMKKAEDPKWDPKSLTIDSFPLPWTAKNPFDPYERNKFLEWFNKETTEFNDIDALKLFVQAGRSLVPFDCDPIYFPPEILDIYSAMTDGAQALDPCLIFGEWKAELY
jgi:hypothetical protein